jgi:hypothetical protein
MTTINATHLDTLFAGAKQAAIAGGDAEQILMLGAVKLAAKTRLPQINANYANLIPTPKGPNATQATAAGLPTWSTLLAAIEADLPSLASLLPTGSLLATLAPLALDLVQLFLPAA